MEFDQSQELIRDALLCSEDLIKKLPPDIYSSIPVQGYSIPQLDMAQFAKQVIKMLVDAEILRDGIKLETNYFSFKNEVYGIVKYNLEETNTITITIDEGLNTCWRRLVFCKEIFQIYCDFTNSVELYNKSETESQIYSLVDLHRRIQTEPELVSIKPADRNFTEFLAFFSAVNMIFPRSHRSALKAWNDKIMLEDANAPTIYDIAYAYRMPEFIINFFRKRLLPMYNEIEDSLFAFQNAE